MGWFAWVLIDLNVALLDELGGVGSGAVLQMAGKDDIQSLARLACHYRELKTAGMGFHGTRGGLYASFIEKRLDFFENGLLVGLFGSGKFFDQKDLSRIVKLAFPKGEVFGEFEQK